MALGITRSVSISGVGLHSGQIATVALSPNAGMSGPRLAIGKGNYHSLIDFERTGASRHTVLKSPDGATVMTVEHLFAAIALCQIDHIDIRVCGPEVPILDGSAEGWMDLLHTAEICTRSGSPRELVVRRPFAVAIGNAFYHVSSGAPELDVTIRYPGTAIGTQRWRGGGDHLLSLPRARTFALEHEVQSLRSAGLAIGGSLRNALVIGNDGPLNEGGYRQPDECAMHKALDLVGDLYSCGFRIIGKITADCPGHRTNIAFLQHLLRSRTFAPDSYQKVA